MMVLTDMKLRLFSAMSDDGFGIFIFLKFDTEQYLQIFTAFCVSMFSQSLT